MRWPARMTPVVDLAKHADQAPRVRSEGGSYRRSRIRSRSSTWDMVEEETGSRRVTCQSLHFFYS